jgi:hypothetical protein
MKRRGEQSPRRFFDRCFNLEKRLAIRSCAAAKDGGRDRVPCGGAAQSNKINPCRDWLFQSGKKACHPKLRSSEGWWARQGLNL